MGKLYEQKIEKYLQYFLWILLIVWRIPFLNKGIDYTDTGFALVNYSNVFDEIGITDISIFYTTLVGGIIFKILPFGQLLVFRILHWIVGLLTMFVTWKILKKHVNGNLILVAFLCISLSMKSGEAFFGYFNFSGLITILMVLLMYKGLIEDKSVFLFWAGILAGFNVFVRLSNVLYLLAAVCIVIYGVKKKYSGKTIACRFGMAVLGTIVSFAITLAIMTIVMGPERIFNSFYDYVCLALGKTNSTATNFLGIEEVNGHSLVAEFNTIKYQVWKSSVVFLLVVCSGVALYIINTLIFTKKVNNFKLDYASKIIAIFGSFLVSWILYLKFNVLTVPTWLIGMMSVVMSICMLFNWKNEKPENIFLYLINIMLSFLSVWGSDGGLSRFSMIKPLQVAMLLLCIKRAYDILSVKAYKTDNSIRKKCLITLYKSLPVVLSGVLAFSVFMGAVTIPNVYNDQNVQELTSSVDGKQPIFWGMKTSAKRSEQIEQYYELMSNDAVNDKEVAIFGYWALGEIIGPQEGYFDSVLSCIDYPRVDVESLLEVIQDKEKQNVIPVIVVSMVDAIQRDMEEPNITEAKQAVLEYMLSLHDYELYAKTDYFTIYSADK